MERESNRILRRMPNFAIDHEVWETGDCVELMFETASGIEKIILSYEDAEKLCRRLQNRLQSLAIRNY